MIDFLDLINLAIYVTLSLKSYCVLKVTWIDGLLLMLLITYSTVQTGERELKRLAVLLDIW